MPSSEVVTRASDRADVCLVLEGTYPYVSGGVSTWVDNLIRSLPSLRFALVHIGPEAGTRPEMRYVLPANVVLLHDLYCREPLPGSHDRISLRREVQAECRHHADARRPSRVLRGIRRLHLEDQVDATLLDDLASGDLPVGAFLHGRESFDLTLDLCQRLAPEASFLDFFWHFRSMHLPLVRLLAATPPVASTYHAVCTGYAGVLAAVWSRMTDRPLLLTEHGLYTRERSIELSRAAWYGAPQEDNLRSRPGRAFEAATALCVRRLWMRFFRSLARCAYARASTIVSLNEVNQRRQIADGAPSGRTLIVPNGVDFDGLQALTRGRRHGTAERHPVRVGFVGRLVPIKNVVTFINACALASQLVELDARIIGPDVEDPAYVRRCRRLAATLGLQRVIRFEGAQPAHRIYSEINILVLTSFSEGQPLVVMEANAAGIPVIASDVGGCRELIEGRDDEDRRIGPSGIVTRLAAPEETAAAIVRLVLDPDLRRRLGSAGRRRVARYYRQSTIVARYRELYEGGSWPA